MTDPIKDLTVKLCEFRDERDWKQFHSLDNLIKSVAIEAGELLELVQWQSNLGTSPTLGPDFKNKLQDEVADIFLYLLLIADEAQIDLLAAANAKVAKNASKYPVEKARGSSKKYDQF